MIRELLREALDFKSRLDEIDFEGTYGDVSAQCLNPKKVAEWLTDELKRLNHNKKSKESDRIKRKKPKVGSTNLEDVIVTRGSIEGVIDKTGSVNIDNFIKNITTEPKTIFDHNPKMEKSDIGRPQKTVNTGLPAIVGIVYDIENEKFYAVNSCPGAGACQVGCYARKGFYGMDDSKTMKLTRRLNLMLNNPERYKQRVVQELSKFAEKTKNDSIGRSVKNQLVIRWNDAGDFFGQKYFDIAKEATKELLDMGYNVKSYAYTKRGKYVLELNDDNNFVVNFSSDAHPKEKEIVAKNLGDKAKTATKVEKDVWDNENIFRKKGSHYVKSNDGLPMFKTEDAGERLKDIIFNKYGKKDNITRDSLVFTYELPQQQGERNQYNLIVLPTGDSDIGAQRKDVKMSYLLAH